MKKRQWKTSPSTWTINYIRNCEVLNYLSVVQLLLGYCVWIDVDGDIVKRTVYAMVFWLNSIAGNVFRSQWQSMAWISHATREQTNTLTMRLTQTHTHALPATSIELKAFSITAHPGQHEKAMEKREQTTQSSSLTQRCMCIRSDRRSLCSVSLVINIKCFSLAHPICSRRLFSSSPPTALPLWSIFYLRSRNIFLVYFILEYALACIPSTRMEFNEKEIVLFIQIVQTAQEECVTRKKSCERKKYTNV